MKPSADKILLDITGFNAGINQSVLSVSEQQIPQEEETRFSDIEVAIVADYSENRILAHITVNANAHLICDRTLAPFTQAISDTYTVLFTTDAGLLEDEESDEVCAFSPSDKQLDLTEVVIDTLRLAVPVRRLAPDAPQEEIQASFGAPNTTESDETDPRWEALKKLKSN